MTQQAVKVDLIPNNRQWQWIGEDFAIHLSGTIGDCWVYHIGQHFFGGCLKIGCCTQNGFSSTSPFKLLHIGYWVYFHNLRATQNMVRNHIMIFICLYSIWLPSSNLTLRWTITPFLLMIIPISLKPVFLPASHVNLTFRETVGPSSP